MKMIKYTLSLYLTLTLFVNVRTFEARQPQIRVLNGHLIFTAARDKNISIITSGLGGVHLNGEDLAHITKLAKNASQMLERYRNNYQLPYDQYDGTKTLGSDGFIRRLDIIEANTQNLSTQTANNRLMLTRAQRRLNMMQRKIRSLTLLLSQNECDSNPCFNGGTCQDMYNSFLCHCPDQWEGTRCDVDVNECHKFSGTDLGCQNGATCVNKPGSYECMCASGWVGLHCTKTKADCNFGGLDLCGHGMCIPQSNTVGYSCICEQGWTTDGKNPPCSVDVNECTSNKPPCSVNPAVQCINLPGSFLCGNCPPGYTGNGYYCSDIDECLIFNGGCSVSPTVQCTNTLGSRICGTCPPGYVGDGVTCRYQGGVCSINNGGCHSAAQCRDNPRISSSYVECICPTGYLGNGIGPFGCSRTHFADPCASNPCLYGTCSANNATGDYVCNCRRRYTGKNCDIRKNPCDTNPCLNGGTCSSLFLFSYICTCTDAYTGDKCQNEKQECGGNLKGIQGILQYPSTGSKSYAHRISCAWVIETNATKVLNITFTKFNIEQSSECRFDWLQIHDGKNTASQMIGRFCGTELPKNGNIITTANVVYLWFRTDVSVQKTGFSLNWTSIDPVCGETKLVKTHDHGTIRSPGSPGNYPPNRDCYWTLRTSFQNRIEFHFFSLMIGNSSNCTDYLEFISSNSEIFAKYCNTSHPLPLIASAGDVTVHFHSDAKDSYPGFQLSYTVTNGIPGCYGVYTKSSGSINSLVTDAVHLCEYLIQLVEDTRIYVEFASFDTGPSSSSCSHYVAMYEGRTRESGLIGKYCGNRIPPYLSIGNEMLIVYTPNMVQFKLQYKSVCGTQHTASSGVIKSRNYPETETDYRSCVHEIIQPIGTIITLNIIDVTTYSVLYNVEFLEVRDGDNENSPLIGHYTNTTTTVVSTLNYLWLGFSMPAGERRYYLNYTSTDIGCGGIIKSDVGTLKSPGYPNTYPGSQDCTWIIVAPTNNVIQLSWMFFNLEQSYECHYDYVAVYDNNTNSGMGGLVGKYCGRTMPPMLLSSSNMVTVKFKTDSTMHKDGFLLTYIFILEENVCGGKYFTNSGIIKSPHFPDSYPPNTDCVWIITVQPGRQILLNVTDFELERYTGCRYDFLEIRNGGTASSPLVGKFCGTDINKLIPSHANQMYLRFKADMTKHDKGFRITWQSTSTGCGGTLSSPRGSIISPQYPEPYSKNTECFWKISLNAGSSVQIVFADLDLEPHSTCMLDYVEIFDGLTLFSKSLGKFCSSTHPPFIRSSGHNALVKFRSDVSFQGRGFHLQYSIVCRNTLKGYSGVIESPNFPNEYPHNQDCSWIIAVPEGNAVNITFSHFELETSLANAFQNCTYDYVAIKYYDANNDEMVEYGKYCGDDIPPPVHIKSNHTEVNFYTDNLLLGNGFRLEWYIDGCVGWLTHPEGMIKTPNYPDAYPGATNCEWLIQADYGNSIMLMFETIDLESSSGCSYDFIEVYNGRDNTYPLLNKFCHTDNPTNITSSGNFMFVKFVSDYSYQGRGFQANYTTVATKCGGHIKAISGSIYSPNYPKNFDAGDNCDWLIEIQENHIIELNFTDVDLVKPCSSYYIKVYDGSTVNNTVLATVCDSQLPDAIIRSTGNTVLVEMRTGKYMTSKGFSATYVTACGGILTDDRGVIQFKEDQLEDYYCSWTIVATRLDEHVSLTLTYLENSYCPYTDGVRIYSGYNESAPQIGAYCEQIPSVITSEGSVLHINSSIGFRAAYSTFGSICGGTLEDIRGYFSSPGYPNNYPVNIECEWNLNISLSNSISLSFQVFDLVESDHCNDDFLEIRENNNNGKLLGVFCGRTIATNLTHVGSLWILFRSTKPDANDTVTTAKGFLAEYILNDETELTGSTGNVYSPLYPKYYMKLGSYSWRIIVKFGYKILLKVIDLYMDFGGDNGYCYYSHLMIYDGYDSDAPLMNTICGTTIPEPFKSTSNIMYVTASYDSTRHGSRFLLEWIQVENTVPSVPKASNCGSEEIIDINSVKNYTIHSPGYPNGYATNLECEWIFTTIPENHLFLSFLAVNLENSFGSCFQDFVKVYSGKGEDWDLLATACMPNDTYRPSVITTNLMKVVFKSDSFANKTGFSALVSQMCGGTITKSSGTLRVSNEYYGSANSLVCQWNITARSGKKIELRALKFDLKNNPNDGCKNYLLLKNGKYADSPILGKGKYCDESSLPSIVETTGNHLYIKFVSETKINELVLEYQEASVSCGGTISLTNMYNSTNISSPNYPNIPSPYTECVWKILAPPGESLRVDFIESFDLTRKKDCTVEYVEIRNGGTAVSPLIGRWCDEIPSTQVSRDNMIFIKYFTDIHDPKNGFKAVVSISTCGGVIRDRTGEVKSPYFNSKTAYPRNADCTWQIIGLRDHYLTITFKTLDLNIYNSNVCGSDYVEITEKMVVNNTKINLGTFCSGTPDPITTSGNEVSVKFKTDRTTKRLNGFWLTFNTSQEECGGVLETSAGSIQSPGYPYMNHMHRNCEWTIKVSKGRRIKIQIEDFDLDETVEFYDQGLAFFNGDLKSLIVSMKSGDNIKFINSSDNIMSVYFWSSQFSSRRGFKLKYTSDEPTICSGDLNQNSGKIVSPTVVNSYYCGWTRIADPPANRTLALTINAKFSSRSQEGSNCKQASNVLSIFAGDERNMLQEVCNTLTKPELIVTPYLEIKLMGVQTKFNGRFNFTVDYNTYPCGGVITDQQGSISSPNFPNKSIGTLHCVWVIKLPQEQAIKANFVSMDLGSDCEKNSIIIRNGLLKTNPKIGIYCGTNMPRTIRSQSNGLWIEYHTDGNGKGFNLTYEPIILGCGGIFYDSKRLIQTPAYPNNYPNNVECEWEIHGRNGYHIGLEFVDRFQIEGSDNCQNDFVEVSDYVNDEWVSLGKICGRNNPRYINSTSSNMKILFRSNDKTSGNGFRARWRLNCGGNFTADGKVRYITSPGYPDHYANYLKCTYNITALHKYINVIFEDFSLEKGLGLGLGLDHCIYDNVTVVSNALLYYPMTKHVYCGNTLPPPVIVYSSAVITLQTDSFRSRKGFKFTYQIDACGGEITEPTDISSPLQITRGPRFYGILACTWNITSPSDKVVIVRFESFHLMHNVECVQNSVEIYDGLNTSRANRLAILCGNLTTHLPIIKSNSNSMAIKYKGYPILGTYEFTAKVYFTYGPSQGCGGVISLEKLGTHTIVGPKGLSYMDCHWQIQTGDGYAIQLNLLEEDSCVENSMKIRNVGNCTCSMLEIRDGGGIYSELISQICEDQPRSNYTTSGPLAWVRWLTNGYNKGNGFRLQVSAFRRWCGQQYVYVSNSSQYIKSPNYPSQYPDNIKCLWRLKTNSSIEKIFLKFTEFDLGVVDETAASCSGDRVEITDNFNTKVIQDGLGSGTIYSMGKSIPIYGGSRSPIGTHQYCGEKATEFEYYSGRNEVIISFYSGSGNHGTGFVLEYKITGCDRNYTSSQGRLVSERFEDKCVISLEAPENTTISLYFVSFYMADISHTCQSRRFEVFDGDSPSAPTLGKICGYRIPDPVFSTQNKMLIQVDNKDNGFAYYDAIYTSTSEGRGCGGKIYNYKGRFTSPMYPNNFRNISECTWEIYIPKGLQSAIKFMVFDIVSPCETDYVTVTTYLNGEANVHTYCTDKSPPVLHSSNRITVVYKTSFNNGGTGWVAQFTALTDGTHYVLKW